MMNKYPELTPQLDPALQTTINAQPATPVDNTNLWREAASKLEGRINLLNLTYNELVKANKKFTDDMVVVRASFENAKSLDAIELSKLSTCGATTRAKLQEIEDVRNSARCPPNYATNNRGECLFTGELCPMGSCKRILQDGILTCDRRYGVLICDVPKSGELQQTSTGSWGFPIMAPIEEARFNNNPDVFDITSNTWVPLRTYLKNNLTMYTALNVNLYTPAYKDHYRYLIPIQAHSYIVASDSSSSGYRPMFARGNISELKTTELRSGYVNTSVLSGKALTTDEIDNKILWDDANLGGM
jgi:hypothetical protein